MRPFSYQAPTSVKQAVALLATEGQRARPLAGGTDLLVQLRHRRTELDVLIDLKRIPELTRISYHPESGLDIGAAVPCARLCEHPEVQSLYPGLIDAASIIGGPAIRERATLGGNLCNASPAADLAPASLALEAEIVLRGPDGERRAPAKVSPPPATKPRRFFASKVQPLPKATTNIATARGAAVPVAIVRGGYSVTVFDIESAAMEALEKESGLHPRAPEELSKVDAIGREKLTEARVAERARQEDAPECPECGKPMHKRRARTGRNAGNEFWGCTGYPDCRGVRQV